MPRNISFALTTEQIRNRTKDVTRRVGWRNLKVGERLNACVKCQGLKPGEAIERLGLIEVVSVRRECLIDITADDVRREGFPGMKPSEFVKMFCENMKVDAFSEVTRIEFRYVDDPAAPVGRSFRTPRVGDLIECLTPVGKRTVLYREGEILQSEITTEEGAAYAAQLVAARKWCVVEGNGK